MEHALPVVARVRALSDRALNQGTEMKEYTILHFSLTLPKGEGQSDIAALLRHLANKIEEVKNINVSDIVFHNEIDDDGQDRPHFTVYYSKK
jgi:hypothetical protein